MNITELRYLVAIRKWGSVSAAAKQLYAAQPNVSKALKNCLLYTSPSPRDA